MKKIRTFIAIDVPEPVKAALTAVSGELARQVPARSVRWAKPAQMHLTLAFLGDTAVSQLDDIYAMLDRVAAAHAPFTLHLDKLGCFPNRKRPRIIWAGLRESGKTLPALKASLDEALIPLGWTPESRPYHPHLTLGRVKDSRKVARVDWGAAAAAESWKVTAVALIESDLRPDGPVYTHRHTSRLG